MTPKYKNFKSIKKILVLTLSTPLLFENIVFAIPPKIMHQKRTSTGCQIAKIERLIETKSPDELTEYVKNLSNETLRYIHNEIIRRTSYSPLQKNLLPIRRIIARAMYQRVLSQVTKQTIQSGTKENSPLAQQPHVKHPKLNPRGAKLPAFRKLPKNQKHHV